MTVMIGYVLKTKDMINFIESYNLNSEKKSEIINELKISKSLKKLIKIMNDNVFTHYPDYIQYEFNNTLAIGIWLEEDYGFSLEKITELMDTIKKDFGKYINKEPKFYCFSD